MRDWHGALLVDKPAGVSSFGVIEQLERQLCARFGVRRRELPKAGHGGTLDPFATGLLVVCFGDGVKLARYFLHSDKRYEATLRLGESSASGDYTDPVTASRPVPPLSLEALNALAADFEREEYLQTPPMHSAKKVDGKPLYELARQGKEIAREPKRCRLWNFRFSSYAAPLARFAVDCSSGTYIRTLGQDLAQRAGTVGLLTELRRTRSGPFEIARALTPAGIGEALESGGGYPDLPAWIDFDRLLDGHPGVEATAREAQDLRHGKQGGLPALLARAPSQESTPELLVVRQEGTLVAVARREPAGWALERVFPRRD